MPLITINQMQKYYGDNHVLKGVDLDIDMGEVISIIGRSGSGKSTLLRCINGLEGYQEGSIKLGGMTITNRDSQAREISRSIGMVFQNFNLFPHMTALENVMLAPRRVLKKSQAECRELAQRMLEKVGLGDRLDYYPANLSGGQQQRVAIARALAMSPKVLLCDEITSALDPELVGEVLKVLEQLAAEGMTLILVTHEMNFAREVGDRVVFMHQGRVWEQGDSKTLFAARECARLILQEGLDNGIARHKLHGDALLKGIQAMGLETFGDLRHKMNNVLGVVIPNGVNGDQVRKLMLEDFGIEIGTSFGPLHGKVWRIGTMGYNARKDCVMQTLSALEAVLNYLRFTTTQGAAMQAAWDHYRTEAIL